MNTSIEQNLALLQSLKPDMLDRDFLLTWEKSADDVSATLLVAEVLKELHRTNVATRLFDSGLAVSIFRDQSTRTRFSFASACNALGLAVQDFDEKKSQVAHGETVRETANMISFMADVIGIRDDMYIGEGDRYQREVAHAVQYGFDQGILHQRPTLVNLQSDIDHPTQAMSDLAHLKHHFGGLENLKGKKLAMTWAYSPSYGKPLSVPQGIVNLMTRFGMDVVLAHPEGYDLMPGTAERASQQAASSGGSFQLVHSMEEAFADAEVVYPKSWAPFHVMEKRTRYLRSGQADKMDELEKEAVANNAQFKQWECTEELMAATQEGRALYMHCLPADITGVSCEEGEVAASVFDRYRTATYHEAEHKPYVMAAMILLSRFENPARVLAEVLQRGAPRRR